MAASSSSNTLPVFPPLSMGNFFWEKSEDHRVGLFVTIPPPGGDLGDPFIDPQFSTPGGWKLAACCHGWLLFRKLGAAFSLHVMNFDLNIERSVAPPIPCPGDVYSYGLVVKPKSRERFKLICVLKDLKVITYYSVNRVWNLPLCPIVDNAKTRLAWSANMENEPPVLANSRSLYWLYGRRHVRAYDSGWMKFTIIDLPKHECVHARLSVCDDQLCYVGMEWNRINVWSLDRPPAAWEYSQSPESELNWERRVVLPLENMVSGMKLQPYDYYCRRRQVPEADARVVWVLGLDSRDPDRVYLWILPNGLYSFHFEKSELVHIADLPEDWLPMNPRIYPYEQEIGVPMSSFM